MLFFINKFPEFDFTKIKTESVKTFASSIVMTLSAYAGLNIWDKFFSTNTFLLIFLQTTFAFCIGLITFFAMLNGLKSESFQFLQTKIFRFLKKL
ncbi:MAG: hypothetical protein Fur0024_3320 [Patescibacteria group bacterium]